MLAEHKISTDEVFKPKWKCLTWDNFLQHSANDFVDRYIIF
jgi:hypothetical protein